MIDDSFYQKCIQELKEEHSDQLNNLKLDDVISVLGYALHLYRYQIMVPEKNFSELVKINEKFLTALVWYISVTVHGISTHPFMLKPPMEFLDKIVCVVREYMVENNLHLSCDYGTDEATIRGAIMSALRQ